MQFGKKHKFALAFTFSVLLSACGQDSPDESLAKIQQYIADRDYRSATLTGKSLLASAQKSGDRDLERSGRLLLARSYFHSGDTKNSARFYDALLKDVTSSTASSVSAAIQGDEDDWHQWLLSAFTLNDRKLIASILKHPANTFSAKAKEIYKIRQLIADGSSDDALSILELTNAPGDHSSRFVRYQYALLTASTDTKAALATTYKLISEAPKFAEAHLLQARLQQSLNDPTAALEEYITYTSLRPADAQAKIYATLTAFQLGQYDTGRQFIEVLSKQAGKHPMVLQLQGMLALYDKDFGQAKSYAEQSLSYGLESFINHLVIGVGAYQQQSWEQANRHLAVINDRLPSDHFAKKMLVETKLQLNESQEAAAIFNDLDTKSVIDVALANRVSKKLIDDGVFQDASDIQKKVANIEVEQEDLALQRQVLSQALKRNEFKQALISSMKDQQGETKDKLRLTLLYLADNELEQAQTLVREWLDNASKDINALNAAAMVEQRLGNHARVEDYLNKALIIDPNNIPSLVMQLNLARIDDQPEQVLAISNKLLIDLGFLNPMVFNHWLEGSQALKKINWNQALKLVKTDTSDKLEGVLLNHLLRNGNFEKTESYLVDSVKSDQWLDRHWVAAILSAAAQGKKELAIKRIQDFINSSALDNENSALFAISSASKLGDYELAQASLSAADARDIIVPNRALIATNTYRQLGKLKQAKESLKQHATEDSPFWELTADIAIDEQRYSDAWQALTSASEPSLRFSLLEKMYTVGNKLNKRSKVKEQIRQYFTEQPNDNISRRRVSQWYVEESPRFAIELLDAGPMQEELKKDWVTTNNLAWLYHQTGDSVKARQYAEHAIEHAPDRPEVIDTYETVFGLKP